MDFREYQRGDEESIIELIDGIYEEYGDSVCLEGAEKDLQNIFGQYERGSFMVLEDVGIVCGTVAIAPDPKKPDVCYLKRLYLASEQRGGGWADTLLEWAIKKAKAMDKNRMELWSDIRFTRAHAFYLKSGFRHDGRTRVMDDGWSPYQEFFYYKKI